ncbi:zinc finger protein 1-like isoform X2 [Pseudomyrmex gracilis]|uniref:zinc finger protein 1-like isoform X2 n=1 Tax=Pseudomyrmex gracilis TaxID=219809 RepID=UPI0009953243|nr:zinc finger protein 1-like isoform X2 [Pseudomyrmex gracilis]
MNSAIVSYTNICRACMKQDENMTPMYDENLTEIDVSLKLTELTSIEIDKFDGMPNMLCSECINYTNMFYNFKLQVQESDKTLRMMLQNQKNLNKKDDEENIKINKVFELSIDGSNARISSDNHTGKTTVKETENNQLDDFVIYQVFDDKNKSNLQLENIYDFVEKIREGKIDVQFVKNEIPAEISKLLGSQDIAIMYVPSSPVPHFQQSEMKNNSDIFDSIVKTKNEQKSDTASPIKSSVGREENTKCFYLKQNEKTKHIDCDIEQSGNANDSSDSDSDYLIGTEDNILGSVNDVVTRIKEIKHENVTEYQCTLCMESYEELSNVLLHIVHNHVPRRGPFFCILCEKDCDSFRELRTHVKTHTGACPYSCFMCEKAYSRKRYLKRHMVCHDLPRYRCQKCGQRFKTKPELDSHAVSHGLYIPKYPCKHCEKRFLNNRTLETHMRVHTGEKPFSCEHCKKCFSQKGNLLNHIKLHVNPRNYTCEICGKRFNQLSTLKDHILLHTGEKPYVCNMCGKAFTVSAALRRHIYYHIGKPLQCECCDMKFIGKYDLRRHMRVHENKHRTRCGPKKCKTKPKPNNLKELKEELQEENVSVIEDANRETVYIEELFLTQQNFTQIIESRQVESEKENENALFNLHSNNSILYSNV